MGKVFLSGVAALAIAGSTLAYAQDRGSRPDNFRRGSPSVEDLQSFADARLAALRAGLSLTAEQQAHWPAFEAAARELQKLRIERVRATAARQPGAQPSSSDIAERLRNRGTAMADMGAALKKLADATDPLYKSLDDNQKRRFAALGRVVDLRGGSAREHFRGGHDERHDFGRGRRDRPGFRG
jgi:hypothetical protein